MSKDIPIVKTYDSSPSTTLSTTWDRSSTNSPVVAVVAEIAAATGTDPLELPPLSSAIDPDALNALFASRPITTVQRVTFQYAGYEVVVDGDGDVRLDPGLED
ncbi:HalOD1 output domain-containing protein [Natronosalvus vescus]|uniref:HalOD1 output domain-containing protein n=1 Tax=Natronosalvus vescus TaxID=2953881 RepID=UPI002880923E|nr:HalOD1 output domain-containing protein [Natronosalvus vescus]